MSAQFSIAGPSSPPALASFDVLVHPAGSEDRWSSELYGIFGLPLNTVPPPFRELLESATVPDDRIRVAQAQAEALRDDAGADVEFRIRRPDGSIRRLYAMMRSTQTGRPGERRLMGLVCDLGSQLPVGQRGSANAGAGNPADDTGLGTFEILIATGELRLCSPEVSRILGLEGGPLPGSASDYLQRFVHPDDTSRVAAFVNLVRATKEGGSLEDRIRRPDGTIRFVQISARRRAMPEGPVLFGTLLDVTERRAAEDAAHGMRERLLAVGRWSLLGEMASGLAHELNQPLAAIAAYAQAGSHLLAREPARVERALAVLTEIAAQALRAGDVIERTRRLVRVQPQERRPTDCNEIVREFMMLAEPLARVHDLALSQSLATDMALIDADVIQLQQLLMILFRNAIDAVESLVPGQRRITIITSKDSDWVDLGVEDGGPGVSDEAAREIFRPFFTTKPGGTGLGLAVCRSIAAQHGGQLMFANQPGGGARFWVRLPIDINSAGLH